MKFDNSFDVSLPPEQAWSVLMDVKRITPCMPGAALTEMVDDKTFKGTVSVRLGPVALTFEGEASFEEVDDTTYTATVKAQGRDPKGRGGANATVTFYLESSDSGSKVLIRTDLTLSGSVAQYGRGVGMIQSVASQLIGQFAKALEVEIVSNKGEPEAQTDLADTSESPLESATASNEKTNTKIREISGFPLFFAALKNFLKGLFSR